VDDFFKGRSIALVQKNRSKDTTDLVNQLPYNNLYEIPEDKLEYCKWLLRQRQFYFITANWQNNNFV